MQRSIAHQFNIEVAMSQCTRTNNLEVHHKRRDGGNGLDNAEVLCVRDVIRPLLHMVFLESLRHHSI